MVRLLEAKEGDALVGRAASIRRRLLGRIASQLRVAPFFPPLASHESAYTYGNVGPWYGSRHFFLRRARAPQEGRSTWWSTWRSGICEFRR